jgi:hypothetical protein
MISCGVPMFQDLMAAINWTPGGISDYIWWVSDFTLIHYHLIYFITAYNCMYSNLTQWYFIHLQQGLLWPWAHLADLLTKYWKTPM